MSRNVDIVGKLLPNKADKDLFDTLFYSDDGLLLLKIVRKKDSGGNIYFEFQVDGASNNYATEDDVDEKIAALGRVLTYKGNVQAISDLPELGNNPGDVWYVDEASAEYVWIVDDNVGSWEELGPVISDVPHAKKADLADYADNLTPFSEDSGVTQSVPFINQGTGCANGTAQADTGSFMQLKEKRGNMVVVNQCITNIWTSRTINGVTITGNNDGTVTITGECTQTDNYTLGSLAQSDRFTGHKYLMMTTSSLTFYFAGTSFTSASPKIISTESNFYFTVSLTAGTTYNETVRIYGMNLTRWFGSTDNIPADLLSHPENFFRYYQGDLSYNVGALVNSNARYLTNIGRNVWDGEHDVKCIPNQVYYCYGSATITYKDFGGNTISSESKNNATFTTPSNCYSFSVSGTGVCVSLYYPGESGYDQNYPHEVLAVVDTGSEDLGAFDVKYRNGLIERNTGTKKVSDLTFNKADNYNIFYAQINDIATTGKKIITSKYVKESYNGDAYLSDKAFYSAGKYIYIKDNNYSTASEFATANANVEIHYTLAESTTEQGTPFIDQDGNPIGEFIPCDDFGSMFVSAENFNGIPMGNEIFYPVDYKAYLDTLVNHTSGDPTSLVVEDDITDAALNARGYYKMADILQTIGASGMVGGTLRQQLAQVGNIDVRNINCINMKDLRWVVAEADKHLFRAELLGSKVETEASAVPNILISGGYKTVSASTCYTASTDMLIGKGIAGIIGANYLLIVNRSCSTVDEIANAVQYLLLAYEKAST